MKIYRDIFIFMAAIPMLVGGQTAITRPDLYSEPKIAERILVGWNTWNNPSMLSHVRMPDGLNLQLKMRKKLGSPRWLDATFVDNTKSDHYPENIRPQEHAYDGSYTSLLMEWEGARAKVQSATDGDDVFILYSPHGQQDKVHVLILETGMLWNKPGHLVKKDSIIQSETGAGKTVVRTVGNKTDIPLPLGQPFFTFESDDEIAIYTGHERTLPEIKGIIATKRLLLKENAKKYGELQDAYEALQSVVAWNLFYDAFNDRGIASVSRSWNERWGGYILFDWDTYFIALLAAMENKDLAYANVLAMTNAITDNGFIPNVSATFEKSYDRSQPPVGSMVVKMLYDQFHEKWILEEVYEKLLSWNRWWAENRDNRGYLSWGSDDHPKGMEANNLQAAKWESGLDNSPMFDDVVFNTGSHLMELASAGLMGLYIADCNYLVQIAGILGKDGDVKELKARAKKYEPKLQELWDENIGIYRDKDLITGEFTDHKSPTHFYPMLAGIPSKKQAKRMVDEHFMNPDEFYGEFMIPSISKDNPAFSDNFYWRGRIWAPMNFLVYMGLKKYKMDQAQKLLAEKSKNLILKEWPEYGHVHENYNTLTGEGDDVVSSTAFYAWGGLLSYIALMQGGYVRP